jgi:signal peptidase
VPVRPRAFGLRAAGVASGATREAGGAAGLAVAFVRGLAYALLCLSLLAVLAVVLAPQVAGVRFATILSNSMRPSMTKGDMIVVRSVDPQHIEAGDIILFRSGADPNATIAHRVVEIVGNDSGRGPAFVTKGDANEVEDRGVVSASRVLGKVQYHVALLGHVTREMREPRVFLLALAVPGSLIVGGELWNIFRALRRGKSGQLSARPGRDP